MSQTAPHFPICTSEKLADRQYTKVRVTFEKRPEECIVFRHEGQAYAYINLCVHMPRRLDCEKPDIFDETGSFLRCSMHGIVYTPDSGTSVSTMCEGEQLRPVTLYEENGEIGFADYRISAILS